MNNEILQQIVYINDDLKYENVDGIIYIITSNDHLFQRMFRRVGRKIPLESRLEFDEYASFIMSKIDSKRSIYDIGQLLLLEYGEDCEPLYERLLTFLNYLENTKKYITIK